MNKVKDEVREILDRLPDDCTVEDIQYHLYVVGIIWSPEAAEDLEQIKNLLMVHRGQ